MQGLDLMILFLPGPRTKAAVSDELTSMKLVDITEKEYQNHAKSEQSLRSLGQR